MQLYSTAVRHARALARLALLTALIAASASALEAAGKRPNILFIFTDDHASHAIGAYGSKINVTPRLDRLAKEGILFRNVFCTNSICGPSRAVILTGKHSHLNGFRTNGDRFDGSQQTFPKILRANGYQTAMLGKWHLVTEPTGFDYWRVLIGQGPYYNPPLRTPEGTEKHVGYTTDIITDLALDWLKDGRDQEKPFLLMLQHKAPHRNWQPGPKHLHLYDDVEIPEPPTLFDDWEGRTSAAKTQAMTIAGHFSDFDLKLRAPGNLTPEQLAVWEAAYGPKNEAFRKANLQGRDLVRWKYQRYIKDYLRCIASVDDNIGRVLDHLDESGLAENTIVIYSSDQGFYLGDHGWYDKRWMYEESLRMPFIVKWPGVAPAGTENHDLIQNLDFAPTFLDIAGLPAPEDMQGKSFLSMLRGERPESWRKSIYYHYYEFPGPHSVQRHYGVRTDRHKLIRYYHIDEWELFDLEKDPDELRSVHGDPRYAETRKELEAELRRLQERYGDTEPEASLDEVQRRRARRQARGVEKALVFDKERPDAQAYQDLDPAAKPLTAGARCVPREGGGVLLAHGGASYGYSLWITGDGVPVFSVRSADELFEARGKSSVRAGVPVHLAGRITVEGQLELLVDGKVVAQKAGAFITRKPSDALTLGRDGGSLVGPYESELPFRGELSHLRVYWRTPSAAELDAWVRGAR